jgi:hypothetical protein
MLSFIKPRGIGLEMMFTKLFTIYFITATLPDHANDTHIALIPKNLLSQVPADFRPISLCHVIFKIITKCIANRLKPNLPDHIHPT